MPNIRGPIHVDRPLTNISMAYTPTGLIAKELFPTVPVKKESDSYFIFDKANSLRIPDTFRADGAQANQDGLVISTATYRLEEHALKGFITERQRENQDEGLNLEQSLVEELTNKILLQREEDAAAILFTDGNWANELSLAAAAAWSANTTVSNPIIVADSAASLILRNAARLPNTCVLDDSTYRSAKEHTSITERIRFVSSESVGPDLLARLGRKDCRGHPAQRGPPALPGSPGRPARSQQYTRALGGMSPWRAMAWACSSGDG
mgnify:CR=1 FL=1